MFEGLPPLPYGSTIGLWAVTPARLTAVVARRRAVGSPGTALTACSCPQPPAKHGGRHHEHPTTRQQLPFTMQDGGSSYLEHPNTLGNERGCIRGKVRVGIAHSAGI